MTTTQTKMTETTNILVSNEEAKFNIEKELWENRSVVAISLAVYKSLILNINSRTDEVFLSQIQADIKDIVFIQESTLAQFLGWLGIEVNNSTLGAVVPITAQVSWFMDYCEENFLSKERVDKVKDTELSVSNARWADNLDSEKIRSVTEVIYHNEDTSYFTEEAAKRGTRVHESCEELMQESRLYRDLLYGKRREKGKVHPYSPNYFQALKNTQKNKDHRKSLLEYKGIKGYISSFKLWAVKTNPYPLMSEKIITMKKGTSGLITGKMDFVGFINGKKNLGIIDLKTSENFSRLWTIQIVMYAVMLRKIGIYAQWGGALRVRRSGNMAVFDPIFLDEKQLDKVSVSVLKFFWDKYESITEQKEDLKDAL